MITLFIQRKDAWRPLFDKEISLPSVQPQSLNYSLMEEDSIVELRYDNYFRLSGYIPFAVLHWKERSNWKWTSLVPSVSHSGIYSLQGTFFLLFTPFFLLFRTLRESINSSSPVSSLSDLLSRSQSSFLTSILVLSTPFTSISETVEQIITSRVHLSAHPQVIFLLPILLTLKSKLEETYLSYRLNLLYPSQSITSSILPYPSLSL